jgi:hypothetical protein
MEYHQQAKWDGLVANGVITISPLFASDIRAHLSLWAYALDVGLFPQRVLLARCY